MESFKAFYQYHQLGKLVFLIYACLPGYYPCNDDAVQLSTLTFWMCVVGSRPPPPEDGEDAEAERKRPRWREGGRAAMERPWKGWRKERSDLQE